MIKTRKITIAVFRLNIKTRLFLTVLAKTVKQVYRVNLLYLKHCWMNANSIDPDQMSHLLGAV